MKRSLLIAGFALILAARVNAAVIFSEPFSYPDGPLVGAPGSPWITSSGTAGQQDVANGILNLTQAESEDTSRAFGQTIATGNVYAGFTFTLTTLPTVGGAYFAHFGNDTTGFNGRLFASTTNAAAGTFRLSIGQGSAATAATGQYGVDLTVGTTYRIVIRIDAATAASALFVNAATEVTPSATSTDTTSARNDLTSFRFRQNAGIGISTVDNLVVATSFAEAAAVPEPATYAYVIGGLGALALGIRRRRVA